MGRTAKQISAPPVRVIRAQFHYHTYSAYHSLTMSRAEEHWHTITIRIPFASEKHATIAKQVIEVDKELQPHAVKRVLEVEGNILIANFSTLTVRLSRLTANAFLENVDLVIRTIGEFGEDAERGTAA